MHPLRPHALGVATLLACAALALTGCASVAPPGATLKKPQLDQIVASQPGQPGSFQDFLIRVKASQPAVRPAIEAYEQRQPLAGDNLVQIARLLGVYNRLAHQTAVMDATTRMVALKTVRGSTPPHEDPQIIGFGQMVQAMAAEFGLKYRNVDNRIFEVTLPDTGAEEFGILTHADVVPANAEEWVLDDGTKLDPFKVTRVGDLLYGRGTIDDKGSIAAVLYAMKAVKDSGLPLTRGIRLMIETTEETGGDAMKYYQGKTQLPDYNIVLDSRYPAVVAEKGTGALKADFPVVMVKPAPGTAVITTMQGSGSANAIPQTATARLISTDAAALAARLEAAKPAFIAKYTPQGGQFAIAIARQAVDGADGVVVKVTGTSAHGSRPEEGVNPVPRLALFLHEAAVPLAPNHYAHAVRYISELFGTDYLGRTLGVAYRDDFMGPLTLSPTLIKQEGNALSVTANVRMPRGNTPDALKAALATRINGWAAQSQLPMTLTHAQGNWMARDPKGAWLGTLLNIFGDTTGLEAKPVSTAGSTTAKLMPNAINFGPAMPGKKYTAHNAKEYKEVSDLNADLQMFTEMLVRIGNLQQMQ